MISHSHRMGLRSNGENQQRNVLGRYEVRGKAERNLLGRFRVTEKKQERNPTRTVWKVIEKESASEVMGRNQQRNVLGRYASYSDGMESHREKSYSDGMDTTCT